MTIVKSSVHMLAPGDNMSSYIMSAGVIDTQYSVTWYIDLTAYSDNQESSCIMHHHYKEQRSVYERWLRSIGSSRRM